MNKFGTQFWKSFAEIIGILLFTACYTGTAFFGPFYKVIVFTGITIVTLCGILMFIREIQS
jgi:hypothetical protein